MRIAIAGLLVVVPLLAVQAQAQNSVLDQAQQKQGNNRNSDAYQRGREDEMRRQDAERRRRHDERTAERNQQRSTTIRLSPAGLSIRLP